MILQSITSVFDTFCLNHLLYKLDIYLYYNVLLVFWCTDIRGR